MEVSLSKARKKPIIPLLLEKPILWPPEGSMGPVFAGKLYIDFCKPNTSIQEHWHCSQFDELRQQLDALTGRTKSRVGVTFNQSINHFYIYILVAP